MSLRTLWEKSAPAARPGLPPELRALYGGDLKLPARPSPYVIANFVASADGVASYAAPGNSGGGAISGGDAGDRFTMGLLRARADAVLVGAATLREAGRLALWDPAYTCPAAGEVLHRWRRARGLPPAPRLAVVTASGRLPLGYQVFRSAGAPVLVFCPPAPAARLRAQARRRHLSLVVHPVPLAAGTLPLRAILGFLRRDYGVRALLCEGGPTLFGALLRLGAVRELFLSVSPRLAGRGSGVLRPGIISGAAFTPACSPRLRLLSVKEHAGLLLLRYRIAAGSNPSSRSSTRAS